MPFVKPNNITTGLPADAEDLKENLKAARRYLNQGIVIADVAPVSVDSQEVVRGELSTVAGADHQFTCGSSHGIFKNKERRNFNGATSTTKQEYAALYASQAAGAATPNRQSIMERLVTLPDTFKIVEVEQRALITYRAFLDVVIDESPLPDANNPALVVKHRYGSYMWLTFDGGESILRDTTQGRFYDESVYSNAWGASSWAGPPHLDPMRDKVAGDGYLSNIPAPYYRRQYAIYKTVEVAAGSYGVGIMYDVHNEKMTVKATNVTIEVEYIGLSL